MLTWTFLGIGNAFAKRNFQSNALLESWRLGPGRQEAPDEVLLIDFGTAGPQALHQLKDITGFEYLNHQGAVAYPKIGSVFITHLHSDHIGGLEELALWNTFAYGSGAGPGFRPQLISSPEILENLWTHSLQGGLGVLTGRRAGLNDYFVLRPVGPGAPAAHFTWTERYTLEPFETDHIRIGVKYDWPSLGLLLRDTGAGATVFFSGDTGFDFEAYAEKMAQARLCFHEVHLPDEDLPVHSSLRQLRTLPEAIRRKTHLYHVSDDWDSGSYDLVHREFAGFARPFHRYVLFESC